MRSTEPPPKRAAGTGSIAEIILGSTGASAPGSTVWAVLATVALHAAAGAFAWRAARLGASRAPTVAAPKQTMRIDHVVDLQPPALPQPSPPPQAPPQQSQPRRARAEPPKSRAASPTPAPPAPPPAPAQAGAAVAVDKAEAPLDFTGFDIASGQAAHYAGGVTASTGTSTQAVEPVTSASATSRARPVQLPARLWSCPWPGEADALRIDEQTVVLRVVVTTEGLVASAELVSDPGYGFGRAALVCVRTVRFDAALDQDGQPHQATSPPIRVRFKRT